MSVFNQNTRWVLSYDILRQQKTGVMTRGLTSFRLRRITSSPSQTLRRRLVRTTDAAVCSTLAARRRPSRLYFLHFATRTVYNTVDPYAAKPDICPKSRFFAYSTCIRRPRWGVGSRRNIAIPFGLEKLEWLGYPMVKKIRRYLYSF